MTKSVKYLVAMLMCCGVILVNALSLKLNISMCNGENYKQIENAIKSNKDYVSTYTHWLLTMINLGFYCGAVASGAFIGFRTYLRFSDAKKEN